MIQFFTHILFTFAAEDEFQPRLPLRGALPFADWEGHEDFANLEPFQENDIVLKWTANGHPRGYIMKHDSMALRYLLEKDGDSETFECPLTRTRVPWDNIQKYRLMRDPEQFVASIEEQGDLPAMGIHPQWVEYQRRHGRRNQHEVQGHYHQQRERYRLEEERYRLEEEIRRRQTQAE